MDRLRIKLSGRVLGILPVEWTISKSLTASEQPYALWLMDWLNGQTVKIGSLLKGTWIVWLES